MSYPCSNNQQIFVKSLQAKNFLTPFSPFKLNQFSIQKVIRYWSARRVPETVQKRNQIILNFQRYLIFSIASLFRCKQEGNHESQCTACIDRKMSRVFTQFGDLFSVYIQPIESPHDNRREKVHILVLF